MDTQPSVLLRAGRGALKGVIATIPMLAVLLASRALRPRPRPPLPSVRAAKRLSLALGLSWNTPKPARGVIATLAHLGIGASAGAAHALLIPRARTPSTRALAGVAYGTAVWAFGYAAALPALGLIERPTRSPRGQVATMIAAHWVYGLVLEQPTRRR